MVEDHVALLHGEVDTDDAAYEIERAVRQPSRALTVPEEADDFRAVLPRELKSLWDSPARG